MRASTSLTALVGLLAVFLTGCDAEMGRLALAGEALASDDSATEGPRVRRVWADAGDYATISPDGRLVTFVDWTTGDVAVHDLTTGEDRRITDKGTWQENGSWAEVPIFSPDGGQVAFMYGNGKAGVEPFAYEIRVVNTDGTGERVVKRIDSPNWWADPMDWSPRHGIVLEYYADEHKKPALALVSPEDGKIRILHQFSELRPHPHDGRFSPDGRFIAYRFGSDVRVIAPDGSRDRSLGLDATRAVLGWSRDGSGILVHARREGVSGIWHVPVRNGERAGELSLVRGGLPGVTEAGYTPDGYYYLVPVDAPKLYQTSVDLASGRVLSEPRALTSPTDGRAMTPAWSPDGTRLAYVLKNPEDRYRVMVRAAEGDEVRELTEIAPAQDVFNLTWSADGSALYLQVRVPQVTNASLRRIDATTGQMTEVARLDSYDAGDVMQAVPTPDGSSVVMVRTPEEGMGEEATGLIVKDLASGEERVLWKEIIYTRTLSISPDGESVAVAFRRPDHSSVLAIVPLAGGEPRVLDEMAPPGHLEMNQFSLPWTADGRHILLARSDGETHRLMAYPVDGSAPTGLIEVKGSRQYPAIHPDGRRLVFQDGEMRQELWVLDQVDEAILR